MTPSSSSDQTPRMSWWTLATQSLVVFTALPVVWVLLYPLLRSASPIKPAAVVERQAQPTVPQQTNLAEKAQSYLRKSKTLPLAGSLKEVLAAQHGKTVSSHQHEMLAQKAPDFTATRTDGAAWALKDHLGKKPIILIFYLGYECNHCVSQLFDVQEDLSYFRELGIEVVAISPDTPTHTRKRMETYGRFHFNVLADEDKKIAGAYQVFVQTKPEEAGELYHATFVIDQHGIIRWVHQDVEPFCGNGTLLYEVARCLGMISRP